MNSTSIHKLRRLWLPLFIIGSQEPFIGKTRLQKLAFLVQYEAKLNLYNFRKHHYGPYSEELDLDIKAHPSLITQQTQATTLTALGLEDRHYFIYTLTPLGRKIKEKLQEKLPSEKVKAAQNALAKYLPLPLPQLLDYVYDKFIYRGGTYKLLQNLNLLHHYLQEIFKEHGNRQALFMLTVTSYLQQAVKAAIKTQDQLQKGVITNLAEELYHQLFQAAELAKPPPATPLLKPIFTSIAETWLYLIDYCTTNNILPNPFTQPLEKTLTEEEAKRLAKTLQQLGEKE